MVGILFWKDPASNPGSPGLASDCGWHGRWRRTRDCRNTDRLFQNTTSSRERMDLSAHFGWDGGHVGAEHDALFVLCGVPRYFQATVSGWICAILSHATQWRRAQSLCQRRHLCESCMAHHLAFGCAENATTVGELRGREYFETLNQQYSQWKTLPRSSSWTLPIHHCQW